MVLTKEAATIDVLSGGRFELGLGSGWLREEYDQAGISFDAPGIRIERLTEAVAIVKGLLGEAPVNVRGPALHDHGATGTPEFRMRQRAATHRSRRNVFLSCP